MGAKRIAVVDTAVCVACGVCQKICPKTAVRVWKGCYAVVNAGLCVGCGKCETLCPAGCISRKELNP